jgi:hypothetical protein
LFPQKKPLVATRIILRFPCVYISHCRQKTTNLIRVLSTGLSSLTRFGLDEKVDKEKTWEEGSEKDGKVGTELNLKGNSVGWEARDDGVSGEGRAGNSSRGDGNGGLKGSCG